MLYFFNAVVIIAVVTLHYEFLHLATVTLPRFPVRPRHRIVVGVLMALAAHAVEVWVFALVFYYQHHLDPVAGTLQGNFDGSLLDCVYFSFSTYTTVGFGDIYPVGDLRFLTGLESLTGLVLITWSASFLYYEMQRQWDSG